MVSTRKNKTNKSSVIYHASWLALWLAYAFLVALVVVVLAALILARWSILNCPDLKPLMYGLHSFNGVRMGVAHTFCNSQLVALNKSGFSINMAKDIVYKGEPDYYLDSRKFFVPIGEKTVPLDIIGLTTNGFYLFKTTEIPVLYGLSGTLILNEHGAPVSIVSMMSSNTSVNLKRFRADGFTRYTTYIKGIETKVLRGLKTVDQMASFQYTFERLDDLIHDTVDKVVDKNIMKSFFEYMDGGEFAQSIAWIFDMFGLGTFKKVLSKVRFSYMVEFFISLVALKLAHTAYLYWSLKERVLANVYHLVASTISIFPFVFMLTRSTISYPFLIFSALVVLCIAFLPYFFEDSGGVKSGQSARSNVEVEPTTFIEVLLCILGALVIGKLYNIPILEQIFDALMHSAEISTAHYRAAYKERGFKGLIGDLYDDVTPSASQYSPKMAFTKIITHSSGIWHYITTSNYEQMKCDFMNLVAVPYWINNDWSSIVAYAYYSMYQKHRSAIKVAGMLTKDNERAYYWTYLTVGPMVTAFDLVKLAITTFSYAYFTPGSIFWMCIVHFATNLLFVHVNILSRFRLGVIHQFSSNNVAPAANQEAGHFLLSPSDYTMFSLWVVLGGSGLFAAATSNWYIAAIMGLRYLTYANTKSSYEYFNTYVFLFCHTPNFIVLHILIFVLWASVLGTDIVWNAPFEYLRRLLAHGVQGAIRN